MLKVIGFIHDVTVFFFHSHSHCVRVVCYTIYGTAWVYSCNTIEIRISGFDIEKQNVRVMCDGVCGSACVVATNI